jgi:hypothetical protein
MVNCYLFKVNDKIKKYKSFTTALKQFYNLEPDTGIYYKDNEGNIGDKWSVDPTVSAELMLDGFLDKKEIQQAINFLMSTNVI